MEIQYLLLLGTVNGDAVRIREKASTSSEVISLAVKGEKVDVIEKEGNWYKVKFENVTGYISSEFVNTDFESSTSNPKPSENNDIQKPETPAENEKPQKTTEEPPKEENKPEEKPSASEVKETNTQTISIGSAIKTSKEIKLRILPNFSSRENIVIASGTDITVLDELNNWVKVTSQNNFGWVRKSSILETVSVSNTETTSPSNSDEENNNPTPEPAPKQPEENKPNENSYEKKGATINVDRAVIRKSPNGEVVDGLDFGVEVEIIGEENDWYKINVKDYKEVYIAKRLLKIK